eukprot:UN09714
MIDFGVARHYPPTNQSWANVNLCGTPASNFQTFYRKLL